MYVCIHMSSSPYIKNIYIGFVRELMVSPLGMLMTFEINPQGSHGESIEKQRKNNTESI